MIKNSIRQLFRTKVKTTLFFVLITVCALLICLGCNLVNQCNKNMERFKSLFVTIGTVEQLPIAYGINEYYDAEKEGYVNYTTKEYGELFSIQELMDMENVTYISGPEHRAWYTASLPDYRIYDKEAGVSNDIIVQVTPEKDCIPNGPKRMLLKDILYSVYYFNTNDFYFCDHFTENPKKLYADKTYIMCLTQNVPHGFFMGNPDNNYFEYILYNAPNSSQATKDGTVLPNDIPGIQMEEVNKEFYEKNHDDYWRNYVYELRDLEHRVPVTATDDLNLIMPFYNNDVKITAGELITDEEFANGSAVCMISAAFAKRNFIKVGDKITLPLRMAIYATTPIASLYETSLKADGTNFDVFFTQEYTIKGFYRVLPGGGDEEYMLEGNEIIVPKKSITADDSNNIAYYGNHISPFNTSFRIPNGTIDEFMEEWNKKGIDDVAIHFYDKGYSKLEDGIKQMEKMALLLLIAGIVMTVLVLVFFSSMMIGAQKRRTAIERSLGATKWDSTKSLLSGLLMVAALGCVVGCVAGAVMTNSVASVMTKKKIFDRKYSSGIIYSEAEEEEQDMSGDAWITVFTFIGMFGFTVMISGISTWNNLREEPLQLLSGKDNK